MKTSRDVDGCHVLYDLFIEAELPGSERLAEVAVEVDDGGHVLSGLVAIESMSGTLA
jgi:hypothetical protein